MFCITVFAQEESEKKDKPVYLFEMDVELDHTQVVSQGRTGTCWCFATLSFLESELFRTGKEVVNLSEMFIVRHMYSRKAAHYIRMHGSNNFGQGGQSHDAIDGMRLYGLVPEEVYAGMNIGEKDHNHGEMATMLRDMLDAVLKRRGGKLTPLWPEAVDAVLDIYLGIVPGKFQYNGKTYTPREFADDALELNPDDYIEITSYSHKPFYRQIYLELPDNWSGNDQYYNVPVGDLSRIIDHALESGYSVVWGGDVSNRDFSTRKTGYGIVPLVDWEDKTAEERKEKITEPVDEKKITQEMRQKAFSSFTSTDDHAMHIVGLAHDQRGHRFYYTKNSHGKDRKYDGYVYMSKPYVELHMTVILLNKNSLPGDIKKRLGID
jgi:bleomycin hydrolase